LTEDIKLTIGVPTSGFVRSAFAHSLTNMMGHLCSIGIKNAGTKSLVIQLEMLEGSVIHTSREMIADKALEMNSTHLLFLDDDMEFGADILDTMFERDAPIVLTNYLMKVEKPTFLVSDEYGHPLPLTEESTGTSVASWGGFGVSLIKMEVFKNIPKPWFMPLYMKDQNAYTTEDVPFFHRARKSGYQVIVDHDASKKVSHVGNKRWNWKELNKEST
jgi:hypothetical protein